MQTVPGLIFYWFSTSLNTILPFLLFLIMDSIIIHVICKRSKLEIKRSQYSVKGQGNSKGQSRTTRPADRQINVMLLLVTFSYLILLVPGIAMMLVVTLLTSLDHLSYKQDSTFFTALLTKDSTQI